MKTNSKEGPTLRTVRPTFTVENDCVDVTLASIRIKVEYSDLTKTFFVAVGAPSDQFSGQDGIPIGKLYDALKPLAKDNQ